jgi:uncharacterized protein (TIGR02145 family)
MVGLSTGAYCRYNNNYPNIGRVYGAIYNWHAVNTDKLCTEGWHVPSEDEWATLSTFLGGDQISGGKIKTSRNYSLE